MIPRNYSDNLILHNNIISKCFKDTYDRLTIRVKVSPEYSNYRHLEEALLQRAVLSRLLYFIYDADIPKPRERDPTERTILAIYVIESALAFNLKRTDAIQFNVDRLERWCIKWKIAFNIDDKAMSLKRTKKLLPGDHMVL